MPEQLRNIASNLRDLGPRRLAILGVSGVTTLALLALVVFWASRPAFTTLYSGLQRDDINRIGPVLAAAGIAYDVDAAGGTVLVETGSGSRARMILAEQGLPRSTGSGYELFDTMGSLGLTSFMQQVTRVRALEGEVARSIRLIEGVKSARVHIVMPDRNSFAARSRRSSASVLIQADARMNERRADAIRHLVAAAVPGLENENVTVLGASGRVLAAGKDPSATSLTGTLAIQRMIETRLSENIARMLEPWLGPDNFRVSVRAALDTRQKRVEETIFDPDSRVERSVQVVKVEEANTERNADRATSVAEDIPEESGEGSAQTASNQSSQRREETTNYEINSRKIATVDQGYSVTGLSASIVVNRERLDALAGGGIEDEALQARLQAIEKSVLAAAGFDAARGDLVNVEAVIFAQEAVAGGASGLSLTDQLAMQIGSIVRALAMFGGIALIVLLGIRPALRMALTAADASAGGQSETKGLAAPTAATPAATLAQPHAIALPQADRSVEDRLQALTDQDEQRAAQVLRSWLETGGPQMQAERAA